MTPEERFSRIENFLSTVAEQQARMNEHQLRHDHDIQEIHAILKETQKGTALAIAKIAEENRRTAEAQRRTAQAHRQTEEAQLVTEEKLNALIETVDRIVRRPGGLES